MANCKEETLEICTNFIECIKIIMEEKGISKSALAKRMGYDRSAISHLLNRTSNLKVKTIVKLGKALEIEDVLGLL